MSELLCQYLTAYNSPSMLLLFMGWLTMMSNCPVQEYNLLSEERETVHMRVKGLVQQLSRMGWKLDCAGRIFNLILPE